MPGPDPAGPTLRSHWEVLAAVGILFAVLCTIDITSIGQPALVLSFCPLLFLVLAAVVRLRAAWVAAWLAACAILALASGQERYAGLSYPAIGFAVLMLLRGLHRRFGVRR